MWCEEGTYETYNEEVRDSFNTRIIPTSGPDETDEEALTESGKAISPNTTIEITPNPALIRNTFTLMKLNITVTSTVPVTVKITYYDENGSTIGSPVTVSSC